MGIFKVYALAATLVTFLPFANFVYGVERGGGAGYHGGGAVHGNYGGAGNYNHYNNNYQHYDNQRAYNRGYDQGLDNGYINSGGGWIDNGAGVWDDNIYPGQGLDINQVEQYSNPNSALNQNNQYNQQQQYNQNRTTQELNYDSNLLNKELNKQY